MSAAGATARRGPRSAVRGLRERFVLPLRLRRRLVALSVLAAVLVCGYLFWLRDSSLVRVETVTVTGVTSDDAERVRASLTAAARQMTTLHVDQGRLDEVTTAFPVVRSIEVRRDFPNGLRIEVVEHRPAALLVSGSKRVPVAADGSVLRGLPVRRKLPLVRLERTLPARRMTKGPALSAVRVAAGLPNALAGRVQAVRHEGGKGMVVAVAEGPRIIFGTPTRLAAKWAAAVRVLADRDAAGAAYVDVRIPERPAAGGLPVATVAPVAPAGESARPTAPGAGPTSGGAGSGTAAPPPQGEAAPEPVPTAPQPAPADAPPAPGSSPSPSQPSQPAAGEGGGALPNTQP